ncbi:regulatory protein [Microlunatus panaciterrae]|uniref:Regulatory protein RecX n=2 Tax=Microlunatus panaciterrae TaxID=400768 RepID=A0ABS2RPJ1_9ACTN|nr:regulatory protein [Microlunatus panaciterrae]
MAVAPDVATGSMRSGAAGESGPSRRGRRPGSRSGRSSAERSAGGRAARSAPPTEPAEPDADPEALARTIVLRKLTAQARTRDELAKALKTRKVPEDVSEKVLDRMEEVGLVDDAEFARSWVSSRQGRRHLSKTALRRELVTKGVDRDQIDEALDQVDSEDERAAALALAEKKLRSMSGLDRQVQYRRLAGALGRRGFGPGIVSGVLNEVLNAEPESDQWG